MKQGASKRSTFHRVACPHLGRAGVGRAPQGRPSDEHLCLLFDGEGERVPRRQQAQCCLSPEWASCFKLQPGYLPPRAPAASPAGEPARVDRASDTAGTKLSLAAQRLLLSTGRQPALSDVPTEATAPRPVVPKHLSEATAPRPVIPKRPSEATAPHPTLLSYPGEATAPSPAIPRTAAPPIGAPLLPPTQERPTPTPRPRSTGGWQAPLLWMVVTIPATLLLFVFFLIGFVAFSRAQVEARTVLAAAEVEGERESLLELVAPTPAATFVPISEDPGVYNVAPTIPAAPTVEVKGEGAIRPLPWPAEPAAGAPDRVRAPRVALDAPVIPVGSYIEQVNGQQVRFYQVAKYAAGWHENSSLPGFKGNVVLAGHHNVYGKVFEHVAELEPGDFLFVDVDDRTYSYLVVLKEIFPETTVSDEQRAINGRWIAQTQDERLTLVTCWPPDGSTHRVIVVAIPVK